MSQNRVVTTTDGCYGNETDWRVAKHYCWVV